MPTVTDKTRPISVTRRFSMNLHMSLSRGNRLGIKILDFHPEPQTAKNPKLLDFHHGWPFSSKKPARSIQIDSRGEEPTSGRPLVACRHETLARGSGYAAYSLSLRVRSSASPPDPNGFLWAATEMYADCDQMASPQSSVTTDRSCTQQSRGESI